MVIAGHEQIAQCRKSHGGQDMLNRDGPKLRQDLVVVELAEGVVQHPQCRDKKVPSQSEEASDEEASSVENLTSLNFTLPKSK